MKADKPCLIACGIMQKEIEALISQGQIDAEVVFLDKELHSDYRKLEQALARPLKDHKSRVEAKPVVVYGDVCLGFNNEMRSLAGTSRSGQGGGAELHRLSSGRRGETPGDRSGSPLLIPDPGLHRIHRKDHVQNQGRNPPDFQPPERHPPDRFPGQTWRNIRIGSGRSATSPACRYWKPGRWGWPVLKKYYRTPWRKFNPEFFIPAYEALFSSWRR